MEKKNTVCRMCGLMCPIEVHVENNRVVKIEGTPGNLLGDGKVCGKGIAATQLMYDLRRLTNPLKRIGKRGSGEWIRITWDEAFDIIVQKLKQIKQEHGPEALVYHFGAAIGQVWPYIKRFMNVYGSPNKATHSHLCFVPRQLAHNATYGDVTQPDYKNSELMVIWAKNPVFSSINSQGRAIINAKQRGAHLIVIDPIFTALASKADSYLKPRPGTDGALALAMINVIIEEEIFDHDFIENWTYGFEDLRELVKEYTPEKVSKFTWVPADQIIEVARLIASTKATAISDGNGFDQHTNVVQTVRTICILRALTGTLNVKGGNILRSNFPMADISLSNMMPEGVDSITQNPLYYDTVKMLSTPHIVDTLLSGEPYPIKAMIVQGSGAGVIASNCDKTIEAFKKLDFLVVNDLFMTSVAEIADLVLPAAMFLEKTCVVSCKSASSALSVDTAWVGLMDKVVEPVGEAMCDHEFVFELGRRMGFSEYFPDLKDIYNEELAPIGLSVDKLRAIPEGFMHTFKPEEVYLSYLKNGFNTPTGKVELYSKVLEKYGYNPLPCYLEPREGPVTTPTVAEEYPLVTSASYRLGLYKHNQYQTLPWIQEIIPHPFVEIHPDIANGLGIYNGEWINVESSRGKVRVVAKVSEAVDPRVVMITHGWGQPYAEGDRTNLLTDDKERCPISGATGNRSFLSKIVKVEND